MHDSGYSVIMGTEREYLYGEFELISAEDGGCPVCGHPTGDCAPEGQGHIRVVGADTFETITAKEMFIVTEDIYEQRQISPFTKAKVLLYPKGKAIPVSEAKKLGLV